MPHKTTVERLAKVPGIGVDRMGNAADKAHDPEILRLENLDTDILPPHVALSATHEAIDRDESNSYLPFFGQEGLRIAATKRVERVSGQKYDWEKNCIITAGGMSGILNCLLAMVEPGDEVMVTDPTYAGIINRVRIAGATPVFAPLIPSKDGWQLDVEALRLAVTSRTRMLIISPGMPTGHVLTTSEWEAVCQVCIKNDLWLLYDAAMERILYDGRSLIHPVSFNGMKERTITVGSSSKELRMIGWRVGWVVGPHEIMNDISLVSISNVVCQTGIAMAGVGRALECQDDGLHDALKVWQERRDLLLQELTGLSIIPPHGGWSMLFDTEAHGFTSEQAAQVLLAKAKIAATPMTGWGQTAGKYLRLVFSNEPKERLYGVGNKIKKALNI